MKLCRIPLVVGAFLALPWTAFAWGEIGHKAVAIVALKHCKPATLKKIKAILAAQSVTFKDPVAIATWPDEIRRTSEDRPFWHYADYGFSTDPLHFRPVKPKSQNAEKELNALFASIPTAKGGEAGRQMAWLFHLMGDIHQPLHASSFSSAKFPRGDNGGNSFMVRADTLTKLGKEGHTQQNLHHLWDGVAEGCCTALQFERMLSEASLFAEGVDSWGKPTV